MEQAVLVSIKALVPELVKSLVAVVKLIVVNKELEVARTALSEAMLEAGQMKADTAARAAWLASKRL